MERWGRKRFKFDKGRGFPDQVGVILGLGFSVCWLGDMYMMWRLITGCRFVMLVVTTLQCNQHCEKISGSQCETLIEIAVIIVRLQLWFCGFPNICPREEEPIWMKIDRQYRSASTACRDFSWVHTRACRHFTMHTCTSSNNSNEAPHTVHCIVTLSSWTPDTENAYCIFSLKTARLNKLHPPLLRRIWK